MLDSSFFLVAFLPNSSALKMEGARKLLPDYTASHPCLYGRHRENLKSNIPATYFLTVLETCDYATRLTGNERCL
jgi:hypothetical protein